MAGYSGKPLVDKLGIREGHRVALLDAPDGFVAELEPLPPDVELVGPRAGQTDVALLFAREAARLEKAFAPTAGRLATGGMLWVAWPKKAAKQQTDLTEDVVRRIGLAAGLVDVKVCAVNEVWSGLKFLRRRVPRGGEGP
jgi:hypothetical protein